MQRPTFTWTELLPSHLIQSVCDFCMRRVAVSARPDLIYAVQKVHACRDAWPEPHSHPELRRPCRPHR